MALAGAGWQPSTTKPTPGEAGWLEYAEVKAGLAAYEAQVMAWNNVVMRSGQIEGFARKEDFAGLRDQFNAGGLGNKTGLRTQREQLDTLMTAIGTIDTARASGTASSITAAIGEARRHERIRYFRELVPTLEGEEKAAKAAEEVLARKQQEDAQRSAQSDAIKEKMALIAESVGRVKLFGREYPLKPGVTANVARLRKRDLALHERDYFRLNPDDAAVRAEVQALQKRLDGIIAND